MSIFAEIESLEQRIQSILAESGSYSSVDDFVRTYTDTILDVLGSFSKSELASINIDDVIESAIQASSDFINVNMMCLPGQLLSTSRLAWSFPD